MNKVEIKKINGTTYKFEDGKWINQRSNIELDPHDPDYRVVWNLKVYNKGIHER